MSCYMQCWKSLRWLNRNFHSRTVGRPNQMIKEVFIGIVSITGFVASVFAGMQLEQRLSAADSQKLEQVAFAKGLAQAESNYKASEGPMSAFALSLKEILGNSEATKTLPSEFKSQIDKALSNAAAGNFEAATAALPEGVGLAAKGNCLNLTSGDFVFESGQTFDVCDSGEYVAVVDANFNGRMNLVVDGKELSVPIYKKVQFTPGCEIHFLKADKNARNARSTVRFACS